MSAIVSSFSSLIFRWLLSLFSNIVWVVSVNDDIGVTEFMISWVSMRISLCQASISFCSISALISCKVMSRCGLSSRLLVRTSTESIRSWSPVFNSTSLRPLPPSSSTTFVKAGLNWCRIFQLRIPFTPNNSSEVGFMMVMSASFSKAMIPMLIWFTSIWSTWNWASRSIFTAL